MLKKLTNGSIQFCLKSSYVCAIDFYLENHEKFEHDFKKLFQKYFTKISVYNK